MEWWKEYRKFVVAGLDEGGYDWEGHWLLKNPETGQFYVHNEGGCSCNGPFESVHSWEDLVPVSGPEDAWHSVTPSDYYFTADQKAQFKRDIYEAFANA